MTCKRDTTRYQVKALGGKILHRGVTRRPLEERHREHERTFGDNIRTVKIGPKVCKKSALDWEQEGGKRL